MRGTCNPGTDQLGLEGYSPTELSHLCPEVYARGKVLFACMLHVNELCMSMCVS
jgi:hypothetical protein